MEGFDLGRVRGLRSVFGWPAQPASFDLLLGVRGVCWSIAEIPGGNLAGMVGAVPLGQVGILCHLAVHEDYRGGGVGTGLTRWAVAYLRSRGVRTIRLYSTSQAESLYRSVGFEPVTPRVVYRSEDVVQDRWPPAMGYRVENLVAADLAEVCGVDYWSCGFERSDLIREILKLHPDGGLVARDPSERVKGYLIKGFTPGLTRIGPFMASTPEAARLLLSKALENGDGSPVEATVAGPPKDAAHGLFEEFGFSGRGDRLRMELGEPLGQNQGLKNYGTTPYLAT